MAVITGKSYWASVRTPNTTYEPQYTINVAVEEDVANEFRSRGHRIKEIEGQPTLTIKRKVTKATGDANPIPRLVDENMNDIDIKVGNGSVVKVQYNEYHGKGKYGEYHGLDLQGVQVLDLVEYAGKQPDGSELDGEEF
jgi:hypothetical protein